ncbi:MAG: DUF1566 domain-containing protein [Betaproteobacteria bacterium]|nr:DUF1566 domain-containing protein [Betaproteobacteria bacterium]
MKTLKTWVAGAAIVALTGAAQAALIDRGGGMIYDTTRNITWLADMNYAKTQFENTSGAQGDADGRMTWAAATAWANTLVYGGYSDWRLPTVAQPDTSCSSTINGGTPNAQYIGYNCTGSEMGHLFYADLGGKAEESVLEQTGDTDLEKSNLALFNNVQASDYWTGLEYPPIPGTRAWKFQTQWGWQTFTNKSFELYALAVRPGDVPEPQTLALALLALGATVVARRRRSR